MKQLSQALTKTVDEMDENRHISPNVMSLKLDKSLYLNI